MNIPIANYSVIIARLEDALRLGDWTRVSSISALLDNELDLIDRRDGIITRTVRQNDWELLREALVEGLLQIKCTSIGRTEEINLPSIRPRFSY